MPDLSLPIYALADALPAALRTGNRLVLTAPTGSGKTTQVPQIILQTELAASQETAGGGITKDVARALRPGVKQESGGGQLIVLQPRRLATRLLARRVAQEMGEDVGQTVGYQTRHESRLGPRTRLRFMTEGLFVRLLQSQPELPGVACVVLDEFHERSLHADVALALVKRLQETRRPDLKLVVMSATLETEKVAAYLQAPTLEAHGRTFPVNISYLPHRATAPIWEQAAAVLRDVLHAPDSAGDVLIFMPGMYEIRRTIEACQRVTGADVPVLPLHGELTPAQQDQAVAPSAPGQRKVIVATNVAETSLTIPTVRHVIDSGLARVGRFDPRRGINVLLVEPIARSSADQRAGRAGRTAPGTCHRLWTQQDQRTKPTQTPPEILRLDLAETLLQLHEMGAPLQGLAWLDQPGAPAVAQAHEVLRQLGALHADDTLTDLGATLARLPMHPRLARMMVAAQAHGCVPTAALWAALVSERDILLPGRVPEALRHDAADLTPTSDFHLLTLAFTRAQRANFDPAACTRLGVSAAACREVERAAQQYVRAMQNLGAPSRPTRSADAAAETDLLRCLLTGFPDHVALYKGPPHRACFLVGGRSGVLAKDSLIAQPGPILALEITEIGSGKGKQVRTELNLASALDLDLLRATFPEQVQQTSTHQFNAETRCVERVAQTTYADLVLASQPRGVPDPQPAGELLATMVQRGELKLEGWDERVEQWIARCRFLARLFPERKLLTYTPEEQLILQAEICAGCIRYSQIKDKPCLDTVRNALSWDEQRWVDQMAPDSLPLPTGRRLKLTYGGEGPPRGGAKIQDLYDVKQHLTVAGGKTRVLLEILGPNFRPLQVTDDLPGFWQRLYPELRPQLSRRYPKHHWR